MHILFLTDNFPPEVNAPASRTFEHCREWVEAGHSVTVITCAPNFPAGKLFAGYRNRVFARETMAGIEVVRVWSYIAANEGFLRRTLDYLSFMVSAIPAGLAVRRPDVVIATSPQFFAACAGYLVSRLRRVPFIFELRDLWPESIRAVGAMQRPGLLSVLEKLELFLYRKATLIVAVTHSFKRKLGERGIDPAKLHVVTNGADLRLFRRGPKDEELARKLGLEGKFVAGYIGTHGLAHALETLLETARLLRDEGRADIHLLFLGDGAAKASLCRRARDMGLSNVTFLDPVPRAQVARYWSLLDASVIHLRRNELFTTVIPSKLFESMAMGVPVLLGVRGEAAELVEREGAGLVFEPEDAAHLRSRLVELAADDALASTLGGNGTRAAVKYDRRRLASHMLRLVEGCVSGETAVREVPAGP